MTPISPALHHVSERPGQREGFSRQEKPSFAPLGEHMCALLPVVIKDPCSEKACGGRARAEPGVSDLAFKEQRLLTSHLQHRDGIPSQRAASSSKCHHCKSRQCPPGAFKVRETERCKHFFNKEIYCCDASAAIRHHHCQCMLDNIL